MCARLLTCPLCSQPGFHTLDALRAGLVSVATRALGCPVCNEVLMGIDKLTIHLFGHTVAQASSQVIDLTSGNQSSVQAILSNGQAIPVETAPSAGIYIPINEIDNFRNVQTAIKDSGSNLISLNNAQNFQSVTSQVNSPNQVIFVQNFCARPKIFSTNMIKQAIDEQEPIASIIYPIVPTHESQNEGIEQMNQTCSQGCSENKINEAPASDNNDNTRDQGFSQGHDSMSTDTSFPSCQTDRLADLVRNSQIASSPMSTIDESCDSPTPEQPTQSPKPVLKSLRILSTKIKTERCNVCGFHFPDENILLLHKEIVHQIEVKDSHLSPEAVMKNYPCHLCPKIFKMRGSLMVHMRVAHPGFNLGNTVRRRIFQKKDLFDDQDQQDDTDTLFIDDPEAGYNCPTCGKNFRKEQHVVQHLKIHDGKQWECDICSKMFTTKYFLKKHKRLHSGEMPYKCNICDKTFTFQQSYHKHRLYHKDEKPHLCNTCGRSFKELSTLHNHERIHTGEKPFACETCGKCFRQRVSYLVHRRIHTGVMPYKCTSCGKSFRYKVSQRTHKCAIIEGQPSDSSVQNISKTLETCPPEENNVDILETSQENQYVFVLNNDGEHVIKKKSEIENNNQQNVIHAESIQDSTEKNNEFMQEIWNSNTINQIEFKENNSITEKAVPDIGQETNLCRTTHENIPKQLIQGVSNDFPHCLWNQTSSNDVPKKMEINNETDFFSLVMSPLQNEMSSPSAEMQHLTLSSPVNNQDKSLETENGFSPGNSNINAIRVDTSEQDNFRNNCNLSTLQTINEDSLKELLNSITDSVDIK